ncbi:MAG: SAM-dependent methyltransferase [Bacteroidetes bacterium HGW-Bacteroidetes-3]|jgi:ubiquinone/menaquinone biosynthesis C-methylase UbiE|nr:MAG: SAM-dependent methyltransferase [Bacteroidetes bacterium HGW-Bacteroidetes-3]
MNVNKAYNIWAEQYDTNINKTRDLEAIALRENLISIPFDSCLEIGCGTGKNTEWLITKSAKILAVDLSEEMLKKAKNKINSDKVEFINADINQNWTFVKKPFDLICFSLVLEHIENLDAVFSQAANSIKKDGFIYIGELHPFKQYTGTKARFETEEGLQIVTCFNHHISDFTNVAQKYGFDILSINEYFDNEDKKTIPRILTLLLKNSNQIFQK